MWGFFLFLNQKLPKFCQWPCSKQKNHQICHFARVVGWHVGLSFTFGGEESILLFHQAEWMTQTSDPNKQFQCSNPHEATILSLPMQNLRMQGWIKSFWHQEPKSSFGGTLPYCAKIFGVEDTKQAGCYVIGCKLCVETPTFQQNFKLWPWHHILHTQWTQEIPIFTKKVTLGVCFPVQLMVSPKIQSSVFHHTQLLTISLQLSTWLFLQFSARICHKSGQNTFLDKSAWI